MPICYKCKKLWKGKESLGWYEMLPPRGNVELNIMSGPYCEECVKIILSTKE